MKTQILTCLIAILAMLKLTSCSTECDTPTKVPLKELNKYVPYTGYDTLKFLYNNTDTQTFIGQGINYFWVRKPGADAQCPEDHESLSIQFKNQQNGKIIKMEYYYDWNKFSNISTTNPMVYFKFYLDEMKFEFPPNTERSSGTITIRGISYSYVSYFYNEKDTSELVVYREPTRFLLDAGILKIKLSSNEDYEIIK
jgi:hypothetical protein